MSRSTPSLLALLGLDAVAGYQNRGRISEMLTDAQQKTATPGQTAQAGSGFFSEIGRLFQGGQSGNTVSTGIGDLVDRFKASGRGDTAQSWVANVENRPVSGDELEAALGQDTLVELSQKTGLPQSELLLRLNSALPEVVNRFTPNGRLPTQEEAKSFV